MSLRNISQILVLGKQIGLGKSLVEAYNDMMKGKKKNQKLDRKKKIHGQGNNKLKIRDPIIHKPKKA